MKNLKTSVLVLLLVIGVSACTSKIDTNPLTSSAWKCDATVVKFELNGNFKLVNPNGETFLDTYTVEKGGNLHWGSANNPYSKLSQISVVNFKDLVMTGPFDVKICTK